MPEKSRATINPESGISAFSIESLIRSAWSLPVLAPEAIGRRLSRCSETLKVITQTLIRSGGDVSNRYFRIISAGIPLRAQDGQNRNPGASLRKPLAKV